MGRLAEIIKEYLAKYSIEANVVGEVTDDLTLNVTYEGQTIEVFNQNNNPVFKL